jgi:Flp pilus assembly protein TadD
MTNTKGPLAVALAMCLAAALLSGCGGAAARKSAYLAKGKEYLAQRNYEKARVEFRNALQIDPNDAELRYENALVTEKLGDIRGAVQLYRAALDADPTFAPAHAGLGRLFVFAGLSKQAIDEVSAPLAKHPDDAALLTVRAGARLQQGDKAGALQDGQHAVALQPDDEDALGALAAIEIANSQPENARALLEKAVARVPQSIELRLMLAKLYYDIGQPQSSVAVYDSLIKLRPKDPVYRVEQARIYTRMGRPADAERVLRAAVRDFADDNEIKLDLVAFVTAQQGKAAGQAELTRMITAEPDNYDLQFALARSYLDAGDAAKAEAQYRAIMQRDGTGSHGLVARDGLAALYFFHNQRAPAEQLVQEVLKVNPRDNDALTLHANDAIARGDPKSAIIDLRSVLRDQPSSIPVLLSLTRAYRANGEAALAEETAQHAVDADPSDVRARLGLAQQLIASGKTDQATTLLVSLAKDRHSDPQVFDLLFRARVAQNDIQGAKDAANQLVVLDPNSAAAHLDVGIVAESERRSEDALKEYRRALELAPAAAEPLSATVRLLIQAQKPGDAIAVLDQTAARFPTDALPLSLKGEILLSQSKWAESEAALRAALARAPRWWIPYRNLAYLDLGRHDTEGAATVLADALTKAQLSSVEHAQLGDLLVAAGKTDLGIQQFEGLAKAEPGSASVAGRLAVLLVSYRSDSQSLARAMDLVRPMATANDPRLLDAYGWVSLKNRDIATALPALEKASAALASAPEPRFHLAMAQLQAGQKAPAEKNLAQVVEHGGAFPGDAQARSVLAQLRKGGS